MTMACILLYFTGMHAIVFGHSRYHFPLIPILSIYGTKGVLIPFLRWVTDKGKIIAIAGGVICVFVLIWFYEVFWGSKSQLSDLF